MPGPRADKSNTLQRTLILASLLLLAAILHFHDIARHSLWLDELFTLQASAGHGLEHQRLTNAGLLEHPPDLLSLDSRSAGPWSSVATSLARDDNHPPLYFVLMRAWRHVFGDSPAAVRGFSATLSLLAVALLYDICLRMHGTPASVWAAVIMIVAGPQIQFSHEARAYMLLIALGLGAIDALVRLEQLGPSRGRFIALGACVLGMMLTHYYAIAPAAALGAYVLLRLRGRTRAHACVALLAAAVVFAIAWGPFALRQRGNVGANNWWILDLLPGHFRRTLFSVALVPFRFLAEPLLRAEPVASVGAVLYVVPLLLIWRSGRNDLLIWWLWLLTTVGLVLATDLARHSKQSEFMRYTIVASPAVYAMLASLLSRARAPWMRHVLPAAVVVTCLYNLPRAYAETQTPKPDWRIPAALVTATAQPNDVVLFFGVSERDPGYTGSHYLALRYYAGAKMPRTVVFTARRPDDELMARLRAASGVWLVVPFDVVLPENYLPGFTPGPAARVFVLPIVQRWTPGG